MTIKTVVLGYLSWKPATGYELKRIISDSETLYQSGNSNQVYRTLVSLHQQKLVNLTIEAQEKRPDRKVYSITEAGQAALKEWTQEPPADPQIRKSFLDQLLWADNLDAADLDQLLDQYLNAVGEKLFMVRVQADRKPNMPERTPRESYIWNMIHRNWIATYEMELNWIRQMRQELKDNQRQFSRPK